MAEFINATDSLNEGRKKLNAIAKEMNEKDAASAPEIIAARDGEPSLNARLKKDYNEIQSELNRKAIKGQIGTSDMNKSRTQFDGSWFTPDFLEDLSNNEIKTTVLNDKSVLEQHIADNAVTVESIDFTRYENLFNGEYEKAYVQLGELNYSNANARTAIIRVKPNTNYRVIKEASERFYIASTRKYPVEGMYQEGLYKGDATNPGTPVPGKNDFYYYDIKTEALQYYLIIYVSLNAAEEPNLIVTDGTVEVEAPLKIEEEITAKNIIKSKNLWDGRKYRGDITSTSEPGTTGTVLLGEDRNGWLYEIKVKPNTYYTISKTPSAIFRVSFSQLKITDVTYVRNIIGEENDGNESVTVQTHDDTEYIFLYLSWPVSEPAPDFIQVEEGQDQTEWETAGYKFTETAKPYTPRIDSDGKIVVPEAEARQTFLQAMNTKVSEIGMKNSYYVDPSGLSGNSYTSAYDMVKMGLHATAYNDLMRAWNKPSYTVELRGPNPREITVEATYIAKVVEDNYITIGGKSGTTSVQNLLLIAAKGEEWFVGALMDVEGDRYRTMRDLMNIGVEKMNDINSGPHDVTAEKAAITTVPKHNSMGYTGRDIPLLWGKDETGEEVPASTTKVITVLVTLDHIKDMTTTIEVQQSDIRGGSGPILTAGDRMTLYDALHILILPSSNTMAATLQRIVGEKIARSRL